MRRLMMGTALAALLLALPSPVRGDEPVRAGTIVSGTGATGGTPGWGMDGCIGAATCRAWYTSACDARLAGQEPALMSSIVDIEEVVEAKPERILGVEDGAGLNWGQFRVQFWTGAGHPGGQGACREIPEEALVSWKDCQLSRDYAQYRCELRIPYYAKWMTITSSPDNTNIRWTLS